MKFQTSLQVEIRDTSRALATAISTYVISRPVKGRMEPTGVWTKPTYVALYEISGMATEDVRLLTRIAPDSPGNEQAVATILSALSEEELASLELETDELFPLFQATDSETRLNAFRLAGRLSALAA